MLAGPKAGTDVFAHEGAALEAVKAVKDDVVDNYQTGSAMINLASTGEVTVSITLDFTLARLRAAVPTIVWAQLTDGDIAVFNTVNIPKGAAEVELAHQFIDFILAPAIQKTLAEQGVDAPTRADEELTPEAAARRTCGAEQIGRLKRIDYARMNAAKGGWIDRWNEIFGG